MNRRWLLIIVSFLTIFSLAASGWLFYQNLQLQKQISQLQTQPSPSPAASPVANPTANWKTYTNPSLKYLLKYPQSWEIQEYPDADLPYVLHRLELRNNNKPQLVIEIYKELRVKTVPEDKVVRSEQITISGVTGTKNWHNSFGPPAEIIIIFDTKTYRILLQDANQNQTVDQILSTFKFLDQNSQTSSCTPKFKVESGPELTASEAYSQKCYEAKTKEECEKVDIYRESTQNFGNSDGIPDCLWSKQFLN